ncbi:MULTISPECIES: TetR/AcrR family transcriptional regulator [Rhizobium/Agrobacterium group]|uniref:TetR/AcrR family transcriptional regulator n=2 Tax=Agrobacterium tumefaciens complex TaxID=1183400 RepID=A0AAE6EKZ7_AGRTU|nr:MULTISPECIES: TetR/AcrR family transcriptional regulator [Rhizobium/Agrobacterium group]MCA2378546.1 TetR/AcrR family transcriptional regulator [Agrobacterium tomkonis RTP8]KRA58856.1 TetR family transcriptional regulator [Rhizobium sp. Root651]MCA2370550.1 TetR/AcrR family transcriptional regulator [Agrobacterium tomkonis CIP 111-78]QCL90325.1 TetR/AcrR family transcriptional regulator [Agrobacterium tumefaciens]QCM01247.1 TetR/AcrR family transcriptional regulator [Agrobacterium tumefacie
MKNPQTRADDILRCARTLIIRGGYNSFSYADISNVVGIRNASIHHHFPSKSDLVCKLVEQYRQEAEAGIAELERNISDPLEQLRAYVGYWAGCIADATHPFCVCALLATEIPVLPESVVLEVRAHFQSLSDWLTAVLERGAAKGRLVLTGTARANAEMFMATVHGAMLSARAHGDAATFGAITRPMLERITA